MNAATAKRIALRHNLELWWDFHTRDWVLSPMAAWTSSDRFSSGSLHAMTRDQFVAMCESKQQESKRADER